MTSEIPYFFVSEAAESMLMVEKRQRLPFLLQEIWEQQQLKPRHAWSVFFMLKVSTTLDPSMIPGRQAYARVS